MLHSCDDEYFDALKQRNRGNHDTHTYFTIVPIGSTAVVQRGNDSPWTHSAVVDHDIKEHNNRPYKIHVTKTGHMITRIVHHIKEMPLTIEE